MPADFETIYARALVEHCFGEPQSVVKLFVDETVRETLLASYRSAGWEPARRVLRETVDRNAETLEFGHLPYRAVEQLDDFVAVFQRLVELSRTPAEADTAHRIDALPGKVVAELRRAVPELADELVRVASTRVDEETHRQEREPDRGAATPLQRLAVDVRDWFTTLDYRVVRELDAADDRHFAWVIRAPIMPGRYGEVLVVGVDGELMARHVEQARLLMSRESVAGAWLVAQQRISPGARRVAGESGPILCLTFDDLVDLAADFEPYLDWLDAEVARLDMADRYVPLSCLKEEPAESGEPAGEPSHYDWRDGGLAEYVHRWLADPAKEHLSVLGEFGTGKSWFSLHFAWEVGKLWREAKRRGLPRPRLPLVIPLRSYAKAADVTAMISQFFFADRRIELRTYRVFEHLNRMGRLLLIFDGFDEMAVRVDRHTMVNNFAELIKVVEPGAKVLLSSRTEHFPDAKETRRLFDGGATGPSGETPRFDVVEIAPLDDEQIERMLRGRTSNAEVIRLVTQDQQLRDLLRRPVMSDLVLEAVPEIRAGDRIDLARVYLYAVRRKLDRDIKAERTFTSRADKLYFLCELAWEMLATNTLSMNYREFPDRLHAYFGSAVATAKDRDHWDHDMRAQTLLVRNADGDYSPAHKSLLEFFVALRFAAELGILSGDFLGLFQGDAPRTAESAVDWADFAQEYRWSEYFLEERRDGRLPRLDRFQAEPVQRLGQGFGIESLAIADLLAVLNFLRPMAEACPDLAERLLDLARATGTAAPEEAGYTGGNCLTLLRYTDFHFDFAGVNLIGADLSGLNPNHDLAVTSLVGADLRGADLRRAGLRWADLTGADLTGARIEGEDILNNGPGSWNLAVMPDGTALAHIGTALWIWPSAELDATPRTWRAVGHQQRFGSGLVVLGHRCACLFTERGALVVDVATGRRIAEPDWKWVVPVRWRDAPALLVRGPSELLRLLDAESLDVLGECADPVPFLKPRSAPGRFTYSADFGVCVLEAMEQRSGRVLARLTADGRWERTGSVDGELTGSAWCASGHVWTHDGRGGLRMLDPTGRSLWHTT
ncbi:MAG TPA: pentapeptide repeat-containing protein, partial [Micromonospora sp.]